VSAFGDHHEQVVFCQDEASGLKVIIAIYSTALGPSLGGTRFYPYASETDALTDVLKLSRGMAYKNSLAGLDHGGGKAAIIGDPRAVKTEPLLRAYGRFVESLHGRYYTACDVGTFSPDMDVVARETRYVTGRTVENGGAGDSSILTAYGVYQAMRASALHRWGDPSLAGRTIGVQGVGKVGSRLVPHLLAEDAQVVITDIDPAAVQSVLDAHSVEVAASTDELIRRPLDIFAPCALGGVLDDPTVADLTASIVCGAANNQLAHSGAETALEQRGVLYAPDYCVNSGGVIQIADELHGYDADRARSRASLIFDTTLDVLEQAARENVTPSTAAGRVAEARMTQVGRLAQLRVWP